jgi:putative transposase
MARIARVVLAGHPHHVTQRGNRRQITFFCDEDYRIYRALMSEWCRRRRVSIWAYCLMPNHVHLVAVPSEPEGLALGIGEAHRRYTLRVNGREGWRGHLWQERFSSVLMDETHLLSAVRYVEMNPVRAGLVHCPSEYQWSSAGAHLAATDDTLVTVRPMLEMVGPWQDFLATASEEEDDALRRHEKTGRPLGSERFITGVEKRLGRILTPQSPGRKRK